MYNSKSRKILMTGLIYTGLLLLGVIQIQAQDDTAGAILYEDSFDDNRGNWWIGEIEAYSLDIVEGMFSMTLNVPDDSNGVSALTFMGDTSPSQALELTTPYTYSFDFVMESDTPDNASIVMYFNVNLAEFDYRRIFLSGNPDEPWQFERRNEMRSTAETEEGEWQTPISIADGNQHTVMVRVEEETYHITVDGQPVAVLDAPDEIAGTIGFGARLKNANTSLTVTVDNLVVRELSISEEVLTSAATTPTAAPVLVETGGFEEIARRGRGRLSDVAMSPNGDLFAVSSRLGIWLYDAGNLDAEPDLFTSEPLISSLTWSPDGSLLAAGKYDGTISVWDVNSGNIVTTLTGYEEAITALEWSPDGVSLASGSEDRTVQIWAVSTGENTASLEGHRDTVDDLSWSPDNTLLASADSSGVLYLWNIGTDTSAPVEGLGIITAEWHPDGSQLALGSRDGNIRIFDLLSGDVIATLEGHEEDVISLAWSPDGSRLASGAVGGEIVEVYDTVRIWDVESRENIAILEGHTNNVFAVEWSSDMRHLISASHDGTIRLWDAGTFETVTQLRDYYTSFSSVDWSPDGSLLASGGTDDRGNDTVLIWDAASGEVVRKLEGHIIRVQRVAWSPDGTRLASAGADYEVRIWDAVSGESLTVFTGHNNPVISLAWAPDGTRLASGNTSTFGGRVLIWDAINFTHIAPNEGRIEAVRDLLWSPDSTQIISADEDNLIRIWNGADGEPINLLRGHEDYATSLDWSPDASLLASGSEDKTIRIWNYSTGETVQIMTSEDYISDLDWSPDGELIAVAHWNGTINLWEARTGSLVATLEGHRAFVSSVRWSPDGSRLASTSSDGTIRLWARPS